MGDGSFQLKVKGRTDLTGAVIASSEQEVQDGLNLLGILRVTVSAITGLHDEQESTSADLITYKVRYTIIGVPWQLLHLHLL